MTGPSRAVNEPHYANDELAFVCGQLGLQRSPLEACEGIPSLAT